MDLKIFKKIKKVWRTGFSKKNPFTSLIPFTSRKTAGCESSQITTGKYTMYGYIHVQHGLLKCGTFTYWLNIEQLKKCWQNSVWNLRNRHGYIFASLHYRSIRRISPPHKNFKIPWYRRGLLVIFSGKALRLEETLIFCSENAIPSNFEL